MVIAALAAFGILLISWILAPDHAEEKLAHSPMEAPLAQAA
jgi:hypothetical protein